MKLPASLYAMASAVLFAAGMPSEKILLTQTTPTMLSGLLYLGSGLGLTLATTIQKIGGSKKSVTSAQFGALNRADLGWLSAVIIIGGIAAPLMLLAALNVAKASSVALLLNFEMVFTALIAWLIFKEHLSKRVIIGLFCVFAGGICLSWHTDTISAKVLFLALAVCLCWATDSNLTAQIKHLKPIQIAQIKGLVAGSFNISLALVLGGHMPSSGTVIGAALTGVFCYGFSRTLFITAMREIGAARAVAYISTEPFIGALLAVLILRESVSIRMLIAGVLMAIGVWLHLTEKESERSPLETQGKATNSD